MDYVKVRKEKKRGNMQVIMDIVGINNKVVVSVPDTYTIKEEVFHRFHRDKKQARRIAIERMCTIKENDIDIIEII